MFILITALDALGSIFAALLITGLLCWFARAVGKRLPYACTGACITGLLAGLFLLAGARWSSRLFDMIAIFVAIGSLIVLADGAADKGQQLGSPRPK